MKLNVLVLCLACVVVTAGTTYLLMRQPPQTAMHPTELSERSVHRESALVDGSIDSSTATAAGGGIATSNRVSTPRIQHSPGQIIQASPNRVPTQQSSTQTETAAAAAASGPESDPLVPQMTTGNTAQPSSANTVSTIVVGASGTAPNPTPQLAPSPDVDLKRPSESQPGFASDSADTDEPEAFVNVPAGSRVPAAELEDLQQRTPQQQNALTKIMTDFHTEIQQSMTPAGPDPVVWENARLRADERYRILFGDAAFNALTIKAALEALGEKKALESGER